MPDMHWDAYWREGKQLEVRRCPAPEVLDLIARESPSDHPRVLDLGCGLGRHAIDVSTTAIAYLQQWAAQLQLEIHTQLCGALDDFASPGAFDIIVSYNAIYHGYRQHLAKAMRRVHTLLKPGGVFFFTCPTRRDGKYGYWDNAGTQQFYSNWLICAEKPRDARSNQAPSGGIA